MVRRISLFLVTNLLVLALFSVIVEVLGVGRYTTAYGIDHVQLMTFCILWGFGASLLSLGPSRWVAKWIMKVRVLEPNDAEYNWLLEMVHNVARKAQLPAMPQVGIFDSPAPNAFATGPTKARALVAFSTSLLADMSREEVEAVAAHEVAHIANGDMVTMTLLQGIINAFVMYFARLLAFAATLSIDNEKLARAVQFVLILVFQLLFGVLGSLVTAWYSRRREFRADRDAAKLTNAEAMQSALRRLANMTNQAELPSAMAAFGISGRARSVFRLWASHPPIERRIAALQS